MLNLNVEKSGNPDHLPLVILHGLFGSSSNWRSIARAFADHFYVCCLDLRNHGNSPWDDNMDYLEMAMDVEQFILDHRLQRPYLIGHSMGGKTAMTIAQDGRIELGKLVIADIAPVPYSHTHDDFVAAMVSVDFSVHVNRGAIDQELSKAIPDVSIRQFLMQNLKRDGSNFSWRINLEAIFSNMDRLTRYENSAVSQVDTLFIGGRNSDYLRMAYHQEIYNRFPNATIEMIPDAGHWLHAEQPQQFVTMCSDFFDR